LLECTTDVMRSAHTRQKELAHAHRLVQNTDDVYNHRRSPTNNSTPKHNKSTSPHCGGCELVPLETRYEAIRPKCHHGNCGLMHLLYVLLQPSFQSKFCAQVFHLKNVYCRKEHLCTTTQKPKPTKPFNLII
jgi:hypothetical protein